MMFWLLGLTALLSSIPVFALIFGATALVSIGLMLVSIVIGREE